MPQIGVQQPTNLMEMFSSASPMMWDIARNQVQDQSLGNALNRAQAAQSMDFEKQKQPYELRQLGLANDTTAAQLPGVTANSSMLEDKASISRNTLNDQQRAAVSDIAKKIKDNDLNVAEAEIKRNLLHPDPKVRKQAEDMWPFLHSVREEHMKLKMQGDTQARIANIQGQTQRDVNQMNNDAGRYRGKFGIALDTRIDMEHDPVKKQTALIDAAQKAAQEGDMALAESYNMRARALDEAVKARNAQFAKPGTLDLSQQGIPTNQAPATNVPSLPQPQAPSAPALKSNYTKDTVYRSRSGSYRFKGGDPANKDNWEKVE